MIALNVSGYCAALMIPDRALRIEQYLMRVVSDNGAPGSSRAGETDGPSIWATTD